MIMNVMKRIEWVYDLWKSVSHNASGNNAKGERSSTFFQLKRKDIRISAGIIMWNNGSISSKEELIHLISWWGVGL